MAKNKATINPKNNGDKCFQYALTVALNMKKLKKIHKDYQKLSLLLISTGKNLNQTINQLLLIFCMCLIIL